METDPLQSSQLIVNKYLNYIPAPVAGPVSGFLAEVLTWNAEVPLVSRRNPVAACERLLLESLELVCLAGPFGATRVADIGSGAGFPGVVWALQSTGTRFLLIERRERKAAFLERLVHKLGLSNVEVFTGESRTAGEQAVWQRQFDMAVTMAVGHPADTMRDAEKLLRTGARFVSTVPRDSSPTSVNRFAFESVTVGKYGRYAFYRFQL